MTLFWALPLFFGLQYTSGREAKNREHLGTLNIVMCSGRKRGRGTQLQISQVEYSQSYDCLGSCLATEHSTMKSSTLFQCGPLPPSVNIASTWHHSHDKCSQAFPIFATLLLLQNILNTNWGTKNWGDLGTKLYNTSDKKRKFDWLTNWL